MRYMLCKQFGVQVSDPVRSTDRRYVSMQRHEEPAPWTRPELPMGSQFSQSIDRVFHSDRVERSLWQSVPIHASESLCDKLLLSGDMCVDGCAECPLDVPQHWLHSSRESAATGKDWQRVAQTCIDCRGTSEMCFLLLMSYVIFKESNAQTFKHFEPLFTHLCHMFASIARSVAFRPNACSLCQVLFPDFPTSIVKLFGDTQTLNRWLWY